MRDSTYTTTSTTRPPPTPPHHDDCGPAGRLCVGLTATRARGAVGGAGELGGGWGGVWVRWVSGWVGKAQTLAQVTSRQGVTELTAGRDGIARQTAVRARLCIYKYVCGCADG